MFIEDDMCMICGKKQAIDPRNLFCINHAKRFIYNYKYDIVHLRTHKKISALQRKLFVLVRDYFKLPTFQEGIFNWAEKPGGTFFRYDIIIPDIKLICEMDGSQHFKFVKLFHQTKAKFERLKQEEKYKEKLAIKNGWVLIRFSYKTKLEKDNIASILDLKCPRRNNG